MKAITLHQPWASLIAIGAKQIETRSWPARYRGPLAIHAAKTFTDNQALICYCAPFYSVLVEHGYITPGKLCLFSENTKLPLGSIVAICNLTDYFRIDEYYYDGYIHKIRQPGYRRSVLMPPDEPEISFGDYTVGRYAWILDDVKQLTHPIQARGYQRLWNFDCHPDMLP